CHNKRGASPGLTAGRGLKHQMRLRRAIGGEASPGLTAGRGLKQQSRGEPIRFRRHRPASRPGAD
ncbi:MAG: hypothetical protein ACSLEZ_10990, partial [Thiobacillus sp.]